VSVLEGTASRLSLGSISLWGGPDVSPFKEEIRLAESLGYSVISAGDSPAGWHDLYAMLTVAALCTERAKLTPMVTTPHLRHPASTTLAMTALQELSSGRAVCTIGSGGGVGAGIGKPPATLATMRAYIEAVRSLSEGGAATWDGGTIPLLAQARPFPIFMSADGPKALRLAGEIADGTVISIGTSIEPIERKIEAFRSGAEAAGRDPDSLDLWAMSYCSVAGTRQDALAGVTAFLAAMAGLATLNPKVMAALPSEIAPRVREMQERYDPTQHVVVGGKNAELLEELDLVEFFAADNAIAGTPEEVREHLERIEKLGVSCLFVALPGNSDPRGTLQRMADAMPRHG
jgi:5,10-methylenetetrahydromethanopterin reductase